MAEVGNSDSNWPSAWLQLLEWLPEFLGSLQEELESVQVGLPRYSIAYQ